MEFTAERMIPEENKGEVVWAEHYIRYIFSEQFIKGKTVLDIACGSGYGSHYLVSKGARWVFGVDISKNAIRYARRKYSHRNIEYLVGDCEAIPLSNNLVDVVIAFEIIEHVKNYKKFLKEIKRVLKPNGLLVLSTPNKRVFPKGNPFHTREFSLAELESQLSKYFRNVKFLFQHNWFSSSIMNKNVIEKEDWQGTFSKKFKLFKFGQERATKGLYFIVLGSNKDLPESFDNYLSVFSPTIDFVSKFVSLDQKAGSLESQLRHINEHVGYLNKSLKRRDKELAEILNSRAWRFVNFFRKIKHSLPMIKKV
jgi:ubiquinone/menaquinone biosynthesis C-methylase UbiE